jgi:hypothetical protein
LSEAKPQAIDQQDQVSGGRRSGGSAGQEVAQRVAEVIAEPLGRQPISPSIGAECGRSQQDAFHQRLAQAPRWTAALLAADSPCSSTRTALPTSIPEAIDAGSTTCRFRVQSMHACEVSTGSGSKYATTHASCDDLSTKFPCLNLIQRSSLLGARLDHPR